MSDKTIGDDPIKDFIESFPDDAFCNPTNSPYQQYLDARSQGVFRSHDDDYDGRRLSQGLDEIRQHVLSERKNPNATVLTDSFRPEDNFTLHKAVNQCTLAMQSLLPSNLKENPSGQLTLHSKDENDFEYMAIMTAWGNSHCDIILGEYLENDSAYVIKIYMTYNQQKEIEGYVISTYTTNKSLPTNLSVLVIDLVAQNYNYIYRFKDGLSATREIERLLTVPSNVIHTIKSTNWTKHTRSSH